MLDKLIVRFRNVSGNKTIDGALTREQAEYRGRRWVGEGHRTVTTSKRKIPELHRVCRRLHILRDWSYDNTEEVEEVLA